MTSLQSYLNSAWLRQGEFALLVNSTQATISKLASGAARPSLDLAVAIERATNGAVLATSWVPEPLSHPIPTPQEDAA